MQDHRIRLNDSDIALIVASLNARRAMCRRERLAHIVALVTRLSDGGRGNPNFRFDLYAETAAVSIERAGLSRALDAIGAPDDADAAALSSQRPAL